MSLSSLIVQREIATIREVEEALARQVLYGGDLVTNLLEVSHIDEGVVSRLVAESFGLHPMPPGELPRPSSEARALVPAELAAERSIIPLSVDRNGIIVVVAEPLAAEVEQELSFALSLPVAQRVAPYFRVRQAIARDYGVPLERRFQRLLGRLSGSDPGPGSSMPPPLRSSPEMVAVPAAPLVPGEHALFPSTRPRTSPSAPVPDRAPTKPEAPAAKRSAPPPDLPNAPAPPIPPAPQVPSARPAPAPSERPRSAPPPIAIPSSAHKKRRGPLTFDIAKEEMGEADNRDAILDLFFEFARQYFDYSVIFVVQGDVAEGRDSHGEGLSRERITTIGVPLDMVSLLATARQKRTVLHALPARDGVDALLFVDLQLKARQPVIVAPIVVRTRAVAIFMGDGGESGIDPASMKPVTNLALSAGAAFERVIVRRKLAGYRKPDEADPKSAKLDVSATDAQIPSKKPASIVEAPRAVESEEEAPLTEANADIALAAGRAVEVSEVRAQMSSAPPSPAPASTSAPPTQAEPHPYGEDPNEVHPTLVSAERPEDRDLLAQVQANVNAQEEPIRRNTAPMSRQPQFEESPRIEEKPVSDDDDHEEPLLLSERIRDEPPPRNLAYVRRPSGPPIPREEPGIALQLSPSSRPSQRARARLEIVDAQEHTTDLPSRPPPAPHPAPAPSSEDLDSEERALLAEIQGALSSEEVTEDDLVPDDPPRLYIQPPPEPEAPPPSMSMPSSQKAVPAHRPPSSYKADPELPSVIVDMTDELDGMVSKFLASGDEEAVSTLLRAGQHAMPAIMARFPGPLSASFASLATDSPVRRASDAGPILALIGKQRKVALPFVLAAAKDADAERRGWATLLIAELPYAEAIEPLLPRLFDEDLRVRRAARIAARSIAEHFATLVIGSLSRYALDPVTSLERRVLALDALGELREPLAVPALISVLGDGTPEVVAAARAALILVTRQDFGSDPRRWIGFWRAEGKKHRVEWLIDALGDESVDLRAAAAEELKPIARDLTFPVDGKKTERERAQQRYRDWWAGEGRIRYARS